MNNMESRLDKIVQADESLLGLARSLKAIRKKGAEPISLRDYARIISYGNRDALDGAQCPNGLVREGVVYVPGERTLLVRDSPLIEPALAKKFGNKIDSYHNRMLELMKEDPQDMDEMDKVEDSQRRFVQHIDPTPYLQMAREDRVKAPEDRRVFEVDYSEIGGCGDKIAGFGSYAIDNSALEDSEVFRWMFKDYKGQHADTLREWCKEGKIKTFLEVGGKSIKNFYGDKPFVKQLYIVPSEWGRVGITDWQQDRVCNFIGLREESQNGN